MVVDYFSRYPEVIQLKLHLTLFLHSSQFSRCTIPDLIRSDNGPQYSSLDFSKFISSYGLTHITSSPLYPESDGLAERMVQTVKHLLKQSQDPFLAWMSYRSTPLPWCSFSPAELLMGRKIRTTVPQTNQVIPKWLYLSEFRRLSEMYKARQKRDFYMHHGVKEFPDLDENTNV